MKSSAKKIELASVDDLFSTEEGRQDAKLEKIQEIPLSELHPFRNHPFKVKDDEAMMETADSIKQYGVLVPAIARPDPEGGYELVAGHRRRRASELAEKETMPVIIRDLDDDAATIIMVDSNLQRESLLPSERAFAYKMKLEAVKHQGARTDLTSRQVGEKSQTSREKEICNAIRTAYLYLFPDKKERKRALSRLNMELVAQSVRYRGESVLAYQTAGNHECSLNYYGPELFPQRGFCIYQKTIQSHSTQVDVSCIRELWLLEDGRFVDVSCVNTKYRSAYERFSTCYRTIHHIVRERDWQDYPAEEVADAFEDISRYPFDGRPGVFYEV